MVILMVDRFGMKSQTRAHNVRIHPDMFYWCSGLLWLNRMKIFKVPDILPCTAILFSA